MQAYCFNIFELSDIFLLPSRAEGFPNVLLEAASTGLPLLVNEFNKSVHKIVENNYNGYVIKQNDVNSYLNKIIILMNKQKRIDMSKNSIELLCNNVFNDNWITQHIPSSRIFWQF